MAVDWRTWVYQALTGYAPLDASLGDRVYSDVPEQPTKPFAVIRLGLVTPEVHQHDGAESTQATVWVHDDPGSYTRIDALLELIRMAVITKGDMSGGGVFQAIWTGDSQDLADDLRKTFVKTTSYRLVGRR